MVILMISSLKWGASACEMDGLREREGGKKGFVGRERRENMVRRGKD